jgi:hypothetical protein
MKDAKDIDMSNWPETPENRKKRVRSELKRRNRNSNLIRRQNAVNSKI